jgi:hypothetical protein
MTCPTANTDLTNSHYTRVPGYGEADRRATTVLGRMHQPCLKEAIMFRICTTAALIALTISAAQAETLAQRIHDAAVKACAVETIPNASPTTLYGATNDVCVYRLSRTAQIKHENVAKAGAKNADTSKLANN